MTRRKTTSPALKVEWTERALADLEAIADYISADNPTAAEQLVTRFFEAAERAGRFPRSGRVVPERARQDIREVLVRRYRIVYRIREREIRVLTVFDGRRLLPPSVNYDA